MLAYKVWGQLRSHVPLSFYPLLGVPYQIYSRMIIWQLEHDDRHFLTEHPDVVVPPARLRFKVVGPSSIERFLAGGSASIKHLEDGLREAGLSFSDIHTALDFGCGCGRTIIAFDHQWPQLKLFGTDVDQEAINWCRNHITGADFQQVYSSPPLPYPDSSFDLVWAISVFSHLDEDRQFEWLAELQRIIKPGGILLASIHGPHCWNNMPEANVREVEERGFVFVKTNATRGLHPEWYQNAWHTEAYVRDTWSRYFEIVAYRPKGMQMHQDLVVLRRRSADA